MLLERAHSVLQDHLGTCEYHLGVFVGILGQPVERAQASDPSVAGAP